MTRTLLVGFDGATLDLCERWWADGGMPALRSLAQDGAFGPMRSTVPFNSAVAWTSLVTGVNPGRHGIFDFVLPRPGQYRYRVTTREDRRLPALWNAVSAAGGRVGVVNIPMTFPAEAVNGVMVSGMDAPRLEERAVHPPGYLQQLLTLSPRYRIISNAHLRAAQGDFEASERELLETLTERGRFVAELARPRDMDLLVVNLEATDGAQHFFWQHHDPSHPRHDPIAARRFGQTIRKVYEATDRELGRLIDAFAPDTVFVVSDHGGGPSGDWALFMNDWLAAEGLLLIRRRRTSSLLRRGYGKAKERLSVPLRRRLRPLLGKALERAKGAALYGDVDWSRSTAYAHMQPAVYLNLAGREPGGTVREGEAERVLDEIVGRAAELRLPTAEPAFAEVYRASEVYEGDAPGGPDVVMVPAPGLEIRGRNTTPRPGYLHRVEDLGTYVPSGLHTRTGMVAASGSGIEAHGRVDQRDVLEVAPSVLAVLGLPTPTVDAGPFPFVSRRVRQAESPVTAAPEARRDLLPDEEEEVLERLRGLGYVD